MAITDLTNTTWLFNPSIALLDADYNIIGVVHSATGELKSFTKLYRGYNNRAFSFDEYGTYSENYVTTLLAYYNIDIQMGTAYSISFSGGDDVTNPSLISWLETNGTLQKNDPTFVFDPATLGLAPGTYSITITSVSKDGVESLATAPITYTTKAKLSAPTIEIDGDTLKLYSENGDVSGFKILVDGEVKDIIQISNFTLSDGSTLTTSDGQTFNVMEE